MKTNIGIETTDEERKVLAQALGKKGMVSRNDIKEAIDGFVMLLMTGADCTSVLEHPAEHCLSKGAPHPPGPTINVGKIIDNCNPQPLEEPPRPERRIDRDIREPVFEFKPSRGDESYLMRVRDERLRQLLGAMLDATEEYEAYVWELLEKNRA